MKDNDNNDFIEELEALIKSAQESVSSALMSDDFIKEADRLLGEIPNIKDAFKAMENHADSSDST